MTGTDTGERWRQANQALLTGLFDALHCQLAAVLGQALPPAPAPDLDRLRAAMPSPCALERLSALFGLDPFATDLVLLCAAVELDGRVASQTAELDGPGGRGLPSIATAFRALPGAHWSAFSPAHPLRYWRLIEIEGDARFTARSLRLDERVLHFLLGVPALDPRLQPLLRPLPPAELFADRGGELIERVASALDESGLVLLTGRDQTALGEAAALAAARSGRPSAQVELAELPAKATDRDGIARLLAREALLSGLVVAVATDEADDATLRGLPALLARLQPPVAVLARSAVPVGPLSVARFDVAGLSAEERAELLRQSLSGAVAEPPAIDLAAIDMVAAQFDLPAPAIRTAARRAVARANGAGLLPVLWEAARDEARPRLAELAERIEAKAGWDDLVLAAPRGAVLREIAGQVSHRLRVYESWGFRDRLSARGLGITALFAGPSGTGKTLAAEVIASALSLDLYRIDLSAVVSKYIGETEKNLRRIFDAAEAGGAVLLFDEADALFGKRSEVKDSHDRYANIEVGYLLQRMESYAGLAILSTNMKQNLDQAFLRRIRFIVDFPFPGVEERAAIWERVFPTKLPRQGLDARKLAQMNLAGGAIRNVALNAAFLAAADGGVVRPPHLLAAARSEYAKLEKPLTAGELRGWAGSS